MGFMEAVKSNFRRYVDFQGRSPRSEYWWFYLAFMLYYVLVAILAAVVPILAVLGLGLLAFIIPMLAVSIRRLHDLDKSGWWLLLGFVPIAGLILLYWYCLKGTEGDNRFGPDPLGNVAERFS